MKEGDSDDEIAELRIQALLTKRENEAEKAPAHQVSHKQPMMALNQPLSSYVPPQNPYGHRNHDNFYKKPPYQYNTSRDLRGQAINSSNIVVLTSSEPKPRWMPDQSLKQVSNWNGSNNINRSSIQKTQPPPLILPQDAKANKDALAVQDANKVKLSARMRRLQESDSDSEDSESDSSDDSSSDSSSSGSSSDSSSSDSDSDSDSSSGVPKTEKGKDSKEPKVEGEKPSNRLGSEKQLEGNEKKTKEDSIPNKSSGVSQPDKNSKSSTVTSNNDPAHPEYAIKKRPLSPRQSQQISGDSSKSSQKPLPARRAYSPLRSSLSPRPRGSIYRSSSRSPARLKSPLGSPRSFSRRFSKSPPPRQYLSSSTSRVPLKYQRYRSRSRSISKSPRFYRSRSRNRSFSPLPPRKYSRSPPPRKKSPFAPRKFGSKSPPRKLSPLRRYGSRSPYRRYNSRSPLPRRYGSRTPPLRRYNSRSPPPKRYISRSPSLRRHSRSPLPRRLSKSPLPRRLSRSPLHKRLSPKRRTPSRLSRTPPKKLGSKPFSNSPSRGISPFTEAKRAKSPLLRSPKRLGSWSPKRKNVMRYGSPGHPGLHSPPRKYAIRSPYRRSPSPVRKRWSPSMGPFSPKIKRDGSPRRYAPDPLHPSSLYNRLSRQSLSPRSKNSGRYRSRSPFNAKGGPSRRSLTPIKQRINRSVTPPYSNKKYNSHQEQENHPLPYQRKHSPYRGPHSPQPNYSGSKNFRGQDHWSPLRGPPKPFPGKEVEVASYPQKFEDPNFDQHYPNNFGNETVKFPMFSKPPPPLRNPVAFNNSNQGSLLRPSYLEGRPPPMEKNWPVGPPPLREISDAHFHDRGSRGFEKGEHYREPYARGRGRGRVSMRIGNRGPWHEATSGPPPHDGEVDPYFEGGGHPRHPATHQKDFLPEWKGHDAHNVPQPLSPPPPRRMPRGPRTPPYSPQREPSPLEWQKRKLIKQRTPSLSPSPHRKMLESSRVDVSKGKRSQSRESSHVYPQETRMIKTGRHEKSLESKPKPRRPEPSFDEIPRSRHDEHGNSPHSRSRIQPLLSKSRERNREQDHKRLKRDHFDDAKSRSNERVRHTDKHIEHEPPRSPRSNRDKQQPYSETRKSSKEKTSRSPTKPLKENAHRRNRSPKDEHDSKRNRTAKEENDSRRQKVPKEQHDSRRDKSPKEELDSKRHKALKEERDSRRNRSPKEERDSRRNKSPKEERDSKSNLSPKEDHDSRARKPQKDKKEQKPSKPVKKAKEQNLPKQEHNRKQRVSPPRTSDPPLNISPKHEQELLPEIKQEKDSSKPDTNHQNVEKQPSKVKKEEESAKSPQKQDKKRKKESEIKKKINDEPSQSTNSRLEAPTLTEGNLKEKKRHEEHKKTKEDDKKKKKKKKDLKELEKSKSSKKKRKEKEKEKEKKKKKESKKKKKHKSHEKLPLIHGSEILERQEDPSFHIIKNFSDQEMHKNSSRSHSQRIYVDDDRDSIRVDEKYRRDYPRNEPHWDHPHESEERHYQQNDRRRPRQEPRERNYQNERSASNDRRPRRLQRRGLNEDFNSENNSFVVTVGSGVNRHVMPSNPQPLLKGRDISGESDSPRIPVHMRLGVRESSEGGFANDDQRRKTGSRNKQPPRSGKGRNPRREMNDKPRKMK